MKVTISFLSFVFFPAILQSLSLLGFIIASQHELPETLKLVTIAFFGLSPYVIFLIFRRVFRGTRLVWLLLLNSFLLCIIIQLLAYNGFPGLAKDVDLWSSEYWSYSLKWFLIVFFVLLFDYLLSIGTIMLYKKYNSNSKQF